MGGRVERCTRLSGSSAVSVVKCPRAPFSSIRSRDTHQIANFAFGRHQILYQLFFFLFDWLLEVLVLAATEGLTAMHMHTCSQRSNVVQVLMLRLLFTSRGLQLNRTTSCQVLQTSCRPTVLQQNVESDVSDRDLAAAFDSAAPATDFSVATHTSPLHVVLLVQLEVRNDPI